MTRARITPYALGKSGHIALQADQRFSYALYVPSSFDTGTELVQDFDVIIAMHGSNRIATEYRDGFSELAERLGCFVLAPLFPIGIIDHYDADNYKYIEYRGLRYDLLLLAMLTEVEEYYKLRWRRRVLHGFSGGGQFAHRFMYLQPQALTAVSVGGPGKVTFIDNKRPWWVGTADVAERFGKPLDIDALKRLQIMLVVGEEDTEQTEIHVAAGSRNWMDGANEAGNNRVQRLASLHQNLLDHGIDNSFVKVAGAAHEDFKIMPEAIRFFEGILKGY